MPEQPIVLILGAGASADLGFPWGPTFKNKVAAFARHRRNVEHIAKLASEPVANVLEFAGDLGHVDMFQTIDAFLAKDARAEDYLEIGKLAIAGTIGGCEVAAKGKVRGTRAWYRHLYNLMDYKHPEKKLPFLAILTFNYDRSLEFFMAEYPKGYFNRSQRKPVSDKWSQVEPVHLHGHLGEMRLVGFGTGLKENGLLDAARSIKVPTAEEVRNSAAFQKARKLIDRAQQVIFLGFGYDRDNVANLGLLPPRGDIALKGTGMNLGSRREEVKQLFQGKIELGGDGEDITAFLQRIGL